MILVSGATGNLGGEICRRAVARGWQVRGLVRATSDPAKVAALQAIGVETVRGDLKDRASLAAACRGVQAVISGVTAITSTQPGDSIESVDRQGQIALVEEAAAAGVRRFVYISYSGGIDVEDPSPLTQAKRQVEARLRHSRMNYTILRPSCFMEVWLSPVLGFDYPQARATIYGTGQNPLSWISMFDVAEFAAQSLELPEASNAVFELGGPEPLSPLQVVRIFEERGGRPFAVEHVPEEALRGQRAAATNSTQQSFAALALASAKGDPVKIGEAMWVYRVRLTSVRDYARRVLPAFSPATAAGEPAPAFAT